MGKSDSKRNLCHGMAIFIILIFRMMVNDVVKDRDRLYRLIVGQLQVR